MPILRQLWQKLKFNFSPADMILCFFAFSMCLSTWLVELTPTLLSYASLSTKKYLILLSFYSSAESNIPRNSTN